MEKHLKISKIFLIVYGAIIAFFSMCCLFEMGLTHIVSSPIQAENVWKIYMPVLTIIGLANLFFGINLRKIQKGKLTIHLIISAALIVWLTLYIIALFTGNMFINRPVTYPKGSPEDVMKIVASIFGFISIIIGLAVIIVPQIIIGKKLYKVEKEQNAK